MTVLLKTIYTRAHQHVTLGNHTENGIMLYCMYRCTDPKKCGLKTEITKQDQKETK